MGEKQTSTNKITQSHKTFKDINPIPSDARFKYLGIHMSQSNNQNTQFQTTMTQAQKYNIQLTKSQLNPFLALLSYNQVYLPGIKYILPHSIFSDKQCKTIQTTILQSLLPKIGYNRHHPRVVVHGPTKYGGLNITPIKTLQGTEQTILLLYTLSKTTHLNKIIQQHINIIIMAIGYQIEILNSTIPEKQYFTNTWVSRTWEFMSKKQNKNKIPTQTIPSPTKRK